MSALDRIIDRANLYFYNAKKSVSVVSRTIALVALAAMLTSVFPTLAEESDPAPQELEAPQPPQEEPAPAPTEESNQEEPAPVPSSESSETPEPEVSDEEAVEEEEEEEKIEIAEEQPRIAFRFPNSVAHDPRANVAFLPELGFAGGGIGMFCISFNGSIDISTKNIANNSNEGSLLIQGDLTSNVRIAGNFNQMAQLINSGGGVKLISTNGRLNWSSVSFGYVELTGIENKPEFCGGISSARSIGFRALGLQMDNVKTRVDFNKPKGA